VLFNPVIEGDYQEKKLKRRQSENLESPLIAVNKTFQGLEKESITPYIMKRYFTHPHLKYSFT